MNRYTPEQIGKTSIRKLTVRSKSVYALYVDQGDGHDSVLVGADWDRCRRKAQELVAAGVSPLDIYGEADARTGKNFYQASRHLWL